MSANRKLQATGKTFVAAFIAISLVAIACAAACSAIAPAVFPISENQAYASNKQTTKTAAKISKEAAKTSKQERQEKKVDALLSKMIWKQKVGQLVFVSIPKSNATKIQKKRQFGGYILFADDFANSTKSSIRKRIASVQKASKIPMLIAVDEEGGTVVRVSKYKRFRSIPFASPRRVYARNGWTSIRSDTKSKARLLKSLGINTNLAPVADVARSKRDFIYDRSFSTRATSVSKYIKTVTSIMGKENLVSTLKHFPGYGNNGDTHTGIVHDHRNKSTFVNCDLKPFKAGIDAGCDMVMVSHNIVHCFDSKRPASISPKVMNYLRKKMDFDGVIVTDAMTMEGVSKCTGGPGKAAVKAIKAGADLICTSEHAKTYKELCKAYKSHKISKKRLDESVRRILMMKCKRGIL